jgi:hypothetical protein
MNDSQHIRGMMMSRYLLRQKIAKLLAVRLGLSGRNYDESAPERVAEAILDLPEIRSLLMADATQKGSDNA